METTKDIQQLLFRTIDGLAPQELAQSAAVRDLLIQTALSQTPFLYAAVCCHIDALLDEFCAGPPAADDDLPLE